MQICDTNYVAEATGGVSDADSPGSQLSRYLELHSAQEPLKHYSFPKCDDRFLRSWRQCNMSCVMGLLSETIANRAALESLRITALVNSSKWHYSWDRAVRIAAISPSTQYLRTQECRENSSSCIRAIRQEGSIGKDPKSL
ncbi:hypothetical protein TNCV_552631 [Trichonephila clavipes]|nr:hypothetical protein TNCV_552631 [Trichonephila clavipes]